jgi:hypothetical protein
MLTFCLAGASFCRSYTIWLRQTSETLRRNMRRGYRRRRSSLWKKFVFSLPPRSPILLRLTACSANSSQKAIERIYALLGNTSIPALRISSLWHEYEDRQTEESKFVKDLDLYELCQQAVEYENCTFAFLFLLVSRLTFLSLSSSRLPHSTELLRDDDPSHSPPGSQGMGANTVRCTRITLPSESDNPLLNACRLDERRRKWAERGWEGYKEVSPSDDEPVAAVGEKKATIPVRVYGSHEDDE